LHQTRLRPIDELPLIETTQDESSIQMWTAPIDSGSKQAKLSLDFPSPAGPESCNS
jgi:hypothetical protein